MSNGGEVRMRGPCNSAVGGGKINQILQRWRRRALRNKGENDLHFWDQSIAHYRALPVRRPASPRRRGMDWSTGASNSGSVIEELVYIGMRAELPATTYTRATGATRGALSYCLHSFIESFHFSLSPLSICLRKFEYSKNCSFTTD